MTSGLPQNRIDAHQHFWKFDPVRDSWMSAEMSVIRKDFLPDDLNSLLKANQMSGCVAVQADQSETETKFLLALAKAHAFIQGVVGWIDLKSSSLSISLAGYKTERKLKGFRHIVQAEQKGFLSDSSFIDGVRLLGDHHYTYDLLVYHHQLPEALSFLQQVEKTRIVIDHIAKPSIRTKEKTHWELNMAAAASFKNVYCKISGMVTEADWKHWTKDDFYPYLDELFETFGSSRLMYGSDWPVCLLAADYRQQLEIVESYIAELSEHEQKQVMGGNAITFYNL